VLQKALAISNGAHSVKGRLGYAYARLGKEEEANRMLEQLLNDSKGTYVTPVAIAMIYCGLRKNTEAFEWLNRAYKERPNSLLALKFRPIWSGLQPDPRLGDLLRKLGLEGKN
jgi:Tfp pilus assembly protein PilF